MSKNTAPRIDMLRTEIDLLAERPESAPRRRKKKSKAGPFAAVRERLVAVIAGGALFAAGSMIEHVGGWKILGSAIERYAMEIGQGTRPAEHSSASGEASAPKQERPQERHVSSRSADERSYVDAKINEARAQAEKNAAERMADYFRMTAQTAQEDFREAVRHRVALEEQQHAKTTDRAETLPAKEEELPKLKNVVKVGALEKPDPDRVPAKPNKMELARVAPSKEAVPLKQPEPSKADPSNETTTSGVTAHDGDGSKVETPKAETPKVDATKSESSTAEAPKLEASKTAAPQTGEPTTGDPVKL